MQEQSPLYTGLRKIQAEGRISFHMPGILNFPEIQASCLACENTEIDQTGDINARKGLALKAMELAAKYYQAAETQFLSNGSSQAIAAMLLAAVGKKGLIYLSKLSHISLKNTAILLDLDLVFLPLKQEGSLYPLIDLEQSKKIIQKSEQRAAVFLCSPNYYGESEDLDGLIELAHQNDLAVILDSAHQAHLPLETKADLVCMSMHKTLPSFTPAALLHRHPESRVSFQELHRAYLLFASTSPSFLLAASMDYARALIASEGASLIQELLGKQKDFEALLNPCFQVYGGKSPFHLIIKYSHLNLAREVIVKALDQAGIDVEFIDLDYIVLILNLRVKAEELASLAQCLNLLLKKAKPNQLETQQDLAKLRSRLYKFNLKREKIDLSLELASCKAVALDLAIGKRLAQTILLYPPGNPLFYAGEILSQEKVELIRDLSRAGLNIKGLEQAKILVAKE